MKRLAQAIVDSIEPPAIVLDLDLRAVAGNAAAQRWLGRTTDALVGIGVDELLGSGVAQSLIAARRGSPLQDGGVYEFPIPSREGSADAPVIAARRLRHTELDALLLVATPPMPCGAALHESEQRYRTLFESSREAIAVANLEGWFEDANPAFQRLVGYSVAELRKLRYQDLTPEKWRDIEATIVRDEILALGFAENYEKELTRKDGSVIAVQVRGWLIRDEHGGPLRMCGIVRDMTTEQRAIEERRHLEVELQRARRMEALGQLASGVAHDFNNILTAILGSTELLRGQVSGILPEAVAHIDQVESAAQRAAALTRRMLAFSRKQTRALTALDLNDVVRALEPLLRRSIPENVRIRIALADQPVRVMADLGLIEQVVLNLAVNARDAMPDGGEMSIDVSHVVLDEAYVAQQLDARTGPHARLRVRDSGVGIPDELIHRVFEPFFTTKPPSEGSGLGLATAIATVKELSGHIRVLSRVGEGSAFEVCIPSIDQEPARSTPVAAEEGALTGSETILVCEDDEIVREVTSRFLRSAGYDVLAAGSAEEALRVAEMYAGRIHLLVTDIVMPGMNGRRLAEKLTQAQPWLKTILVSGYVNVHGGTPDVLEKPFSRRVLLRRVRGVLDAERVR